MTGVPEEKSKVWPSASGNGADPDAVFGAGRDAGTEAVVDGWGGVARRRRKWVQAYATSRTAATTRT